MNAGVKTGTTKMNACIRYKNAMPWTILCNGNYLANTVDFYFKKSFSYCNGMFTKATVINKAKPLPTYNLSCTAGLHKIWKNGFSWISGLLHHVIQNISQLLQFKYDLKK